MIVKFSVENWMSFSNSTTFSMVASRERQHGSRVPQIEKYQTRILPIAAIYGGNASGKTNLFKALNFAKDFIVIGTKPESLIKVDPFRLNADGVNSPSRFLFELLIDETIYEYSFALTRNIVIEEKLVEVLSAREKILFLRKDGLVQFDSSLDKDQFLHFAFRGTRDNQLFLTNSVSQKVDTFKPVYNWFKNCLQLIAPDSKFGPFHQIINKNNPLYKTMNAMLSQLDTGIASIGSENISIENIPFPDELKSKILEDLKDNMIVCLREEPTNMLFVIKRINGELKASKLVTFHPKQDGSTVKFEMNQESDGSQRIIDILPSFLELSNVGSKKVFVIDEVDRSLHTLLTRQLLESYLGTCSHISRSQLLFTTHDVLLMDQELLRRDEMWIAERNLNGSSRLVAFSEYKDIRYDKDLRKSYLQGRLGGVPRILLKGALSTQCNNSEGEVNI